MQHTVSKTCIVCKTVFSTKHSKQLSCSHKCGFVLQWQTRQKRANKTCLICKRSFHPRNASMRYCSRMCYFKKEYKSVRYALSCETCGKTYQVQNARKNKSRFCSSSCHAKTVFKNVQYTYPTGENHPNWKGGSYINNDGYKVLRISGKKRYEHRVVMERSLGRSLMRYEHVHHIDGNKLNNSLDNLMLFKNSREHAAFHIKMTGVAHGYPH